MGVIIKQIARKTKNLHRKKLRDENEGDLFRGFSCYLGAAKKRHIARLLVIMP